MKPIMRARIAAVSALVASLQMLANNNAMPYFSIRSQSVNSVRELVGWQEFINRCNQEENYYTFGFPVEFSQSFRAERITECLFGNDVTCKNECASITISGACVENRGPREWFADYFGLPQDFQSTIKFNPRISNLVADLHFFVGLDEWTQGLYARLHLPITWTKWKLRFSETVTAVGTRSYVSGYFAPIAIQRQALLANATEFFTGADAPNLGDTVVFQKLDCSKWEPCPCGITKLADVELVLGYNIFCEDDYHFGLNIRTSAPSGNAPRGEFLFEQIVGNGKHWELGGGLSGHAVVWESDESDASIGLYLDANLTHLFKTCQTRCFDLCGKPNSRYMLAEKMKDTDDGLEGTIDSTTTPSDTEFANVFAPIANLTKSKVDVSAAIQGDVAVKLAFFHGDGFSWDIGYNFWGRSCEKICARKGCPASKLSNEQWAIKGDAHVFGFERGTGAHPLGATMSQATINTGKNYKTCDTAGINEAAQNLNIDSPQIASDDSGPLFALSNLQNRANTSIQPVLLSENNIDYAGTRGISHKLFTHFNYAWDASEKGLTPYVGVGASVEFAQGEDDSPCKKKCPANCDTTNKVKKSSCKTCGLSQWSVWLAGGIAFNT